MQLLKVVQAAVVGLFGGLGFAELVLQIAHLHVGVAGLAAPVRVVGLGMQEPFVVVPGAGQQLLAHVVHSRNPIEVLLREHDRHFFERVAGVVVLCTASMRA